MRSGAAAVCGRADAGHLSQRGRASGGSRRRGPDPAGDGEHIRMAHRGRCVQADLALRRHHGLHADDPDGPALGPHLFCGAEPADARALQDFVCARAVHRRAEPAVLHDDPLCVPVSLRIQRQPCGEPAAQADLGLHGPERPAGAQGQRRARHHPEDQHRRRRRGPRGRDARGGAGQQPALRVQAVLLHRH